MGAAMTVTMGSKQFERSRAVVTLVAVVSLILGLAAVSAILVPTQRAGAATDVVTNCNSSGSGSLPDTVSNANPGDTITFALSPACSTITLTNQLNISGLTISGPGAGSLAGQWRRHDRGPLQRVLSDLIHLRTDHRGRGRQLVGRRWHLEQWRDIDRFRLRLLGQHIHLLRWGHLERRVAQRHGHHVLGQQFDLGRVRGRCDSGGQRNGDRGQQHLF